MDFFLQDESSFDNQDLLDHGNHRCVALLSDRRHGIHLPADRDVFNLDPLPSEVFVYHLLMTDGVDVHPHIPLHLPAIYRDIFAMQRNNDLAGSWARRHLGG